ncbi:hypothetical protein GN958_ATG12217 [Phytophthora infestans]|uniref:BZIP domain-containing protein n=1 Tax=Phytophthora infestans TaxID=4787 RepID=A0A8S9UDA8_PHYIN|nr:hypothetical protein GN958_ATG12217 [Phytophthora infestans]
MADVHQLSMERPHILQYPRDEIAGLAFHQTPIATFTELLNAAQSVEMQTSSAGKAQANSKSECSLTRRRLQNRVSCRKTRLKRKLQHHERQVLAHERQERHQYLSQLAHKLGVIDGKEFVHTSCGTNLDKLFREFAVKSLHYALVDHEYPGWVNVASDQMTARKDTSQDRQGDASPSTRRSKRLRRVHDKDVATALQSDPRAPQASLVEQWRSVVDGLQNVDLKLHRMKETDLGASVFERQCYWKFVAVSSTKVQQEGEIAAVAVSGVTSLKFYQRQVQEVNIRSIRRDQDAHFDFAASPSNIDAAN